MAKYLLLGLATVGALPEESILEEPKDLLCRPGKYGIPTMENRRIQNDFCMEHAPRTCCDDKDALRIYGQQEILRKQTETSKECVALISDVLCSHCDPDIGSGVADGMCIDYCDRLFDVCKEEFFDPYISAGDSVPFCRNDSLICSRIDEKVANGTEFCQLMGLPVSRHQTPTFRLDYDCFNGQTTVGVKYDRLEVDYDLINTRDYPDRDDLYDEPHPLSWDYDDETGDDMFDNLGMMLFGGSGMVSSVYRGVIGPSLSGFRRIYKNSYLEGVFQYIAMILALGIGYELFINRKVQNRLPCCTKGSKPRARAPEAAQDIARQERIRMIEERIKKRAQEQRDEKAQREERKAEAEMKSQDDEVEESNASQQQKGQKKQTKGGSKKRR